MTITPLSLGAEIVRRANATGRAVSNLSLQKLAYFCHGWHLAFQNEPLVDEEFEAWKLGPVLPSLYHTYKAFSSNPVPPSHPIVALQEPLNAESRTSQIIDSVLNAYGKFSSADLVTVSHLPESPWDIIWKDKNSNGTIPNQAILEYFKKLAEKRN